jgi:hypothetical protein
VLRFPLARRTGVNLVATRGAPAAWLVAHLDTKSQPMPTLVRAALLLATGVSLLSTLGLALGASVGAAPWVVPIVGAIAGLLLSFATVGNASPGALDNTSGVAAVLGAVEMVPRDVALGVVLSSAEELGLAGMRAWVRDRAPGIAYNVDTVDDVGALRCMVHGRHSRDLIAGVVAAADHAGMPAVRVSRVIPGLLTDGVALGDAGWHSVTLSRGTVGTLARIHQPGDSVERVTGSGADSVARLLAHVLTQRT